MLFCGVILLDDGKTEKKITIDLVPFRPINQFCYKCQGTFHTEPLTSLLEQDDKFGFVVVDGNGLLLATLQGNHREILQRITVQLPKKHGRGGQSANRFARLREEKRHAWTVKVCEACAQTFIQGDKLTVRSLIFAGSANIKHDVLGSEKLD